MWWGRDAAAWTALAAWATVIVYIGLFFYARRQVGEARRLREEQARPFVVADFEVGPPIILTLENLGRTLARDVTIRFDERIEATGLLETNKPYDVNEVRLLREPLPVLPPGKKIRVLFDSQKRFTSDAVKERGLAPGVGSRAMLEVLTSHREGGPGERSIRWQAVRRNRPASTSVGGQPDRPARPGVGGGADQQRPAHAGRGHGPRR